MMTRSAPRPARFSDAPGGWLSRGGLLAAAFALVVLASGCTTVLVRNPVPEEKIDAAKPYGIEAPNLRIWGDFITDEQIEALIERQRAIIQARYGGNIEPGQTIENYSLALSGGGPDGAFGAGLLAGWTERGDRPQFQVVNGISTGAIVALFAFLGPKYDATLKEIYTTYTTDQVLTPTIFAGLTGGTALTSTAGYRQLIDKYLTEEVLAEIAAEYARGRFLLIGTTNIDASRPVNWNLGAIAASGHPDALTLARDIIQASSAIPAAFPPVLIPVEADGRVYDEMHVDGGATQQVAIFSPQLPLARFDEAAGVDVDRTIYVIFNNKLHKPYDPVRPRIWAIAGTAASSLISGSSTGDLYKILAIAQRDDVDMRVTWIPRSFDIEADGAFDPVYMGALYDLGYEYGLRGDDWSPYPPDYTPAD